MLHNGFVPPSDASTPVYGNASVAGTGDTSLIAAAGAGIRNYLESLQIINTGATTVLITIKDGSGGSTLGYGIAPAGGGSNPVYKKPLVSSANTAIFFSCDQSSTTVYLSAQGYIKA